MGWLLDASEFLPRTHCGPGWAPWLVAAAQAADAAIALAYFALPPALLALWRFRRATGTPHAWVPLLFAAFILLCGLTYVGQVLSFYWPAYRLFTLVSLLTAAVSLAAAVAFPVWVRAVIATPAAQAALAQSGAGLRAVAEQREQILALRKVVRDQEAEIARRGRIAAKASVYLEEVRARADDAANQKLLEARDLLRQARDSDSGTDLLGGR